MAGVVFKPPAFTRALISLLESWWERYFCGGCVTVVWVAACNHWWILSSPTMTARHATPRFTLPTLTARRHVLVITWAGACGRPEPETWRRGVKRGSGGEGLMWQVLMYGYDIITYIPKIPTPHIPSEGECTSTISFPSTSKILPLWKTLLHCIHMI